MPTFTTITVQTHQGERTFTVGQPDPTDPSVNVASIVQDGSRYKVRSGGNTTGYAAAKVTNAS